MMVVARSRCVEREWGVCVRVFGVRVAVGVKKGVFS